MLPEPGHYAWALSLTGTQLHIEHTEPEGALTYWHVQDLWVTEADLRVVKGLVGALALELAVPFRVVRNRIRFEDTARQPFVPPVPDTHHRNETLARVADVRVALQAAHVAPPWTLSATAGASLPTGHTERNPFALGRAGERHQHIQFGNGTVDPTISAAASRRVGMWSFTTSTYARLTLAPNDKGYRAGNRFGASLSAAHAFHGGWAARAGLDAAREQPERWDGRIEEEGNLGRTDLFLSLGGSRPLAGSGSLGLSLRVPLVSKVQGPQVDLPLVVQLVLSR